MQMVYNMREQEGNHINKYSCVSHTHHIHKRKFVLHSHVKYKFCSEIYSPCGVPITFVFISVRITFLLSFENVAHELLMRFHIFPALIYVKNIFTRRLHFYVVTNI